MKRLIIGLALVVAVIFVMGFLLKAITLLIIGAIVGAAAVALVKYKA